MKAPILFASVIGVLLQACGFPLVSHTREESFHQVWVKEETPRERGAWIAVSLLNTRTDTTRIPLLYSRVAWGAPYTGYLTIHGAFDSIVTARAVFTDRGDSLHEWPLHPAAVNGARKPSHLEGHHYFSSGPHAPPLVWADIDSLRLEVSFSARAEGRLYEYRIVQPFKKFLHEGWVNMGFMHAMSV